MLFQLLYVFFRGEYRIVYVTPEYITLDTEFFRNVEKNVGKYQVVNKV